MSKSKIPQSPPHSPSPTARPSVSKQSPFVDERLDGMVRYHHSVGKSEEEPTHTPGGTKRKRRKYEGPSHGYLKVENKSYCASMTPKRPVEAYYISLAALMDAKERFITDKAIYTRTKSVEAGHFYYSVRYIETTLDNLLKVYLSCTNHQEFIVGLNWYIQEDQFLNPFSLHTLYHNSDPKNFYHRMIDTTGHAEVTSSHFESILIDQLTRLKKEADEDYTVYLAGDEEFTERATKTIQFANSCIKKIAEFCRLFTEEERSAFLKRLNQKIARGDFYNPVKLLSLYGGASVPYDIAKADNGCCFLAIAWAEDLSNVPLRPTFQCARPSSLLEAIKEEEVVSNTTVKRTKKTTDALGVVTETIIEKTTQTIRKHSIFSLDSVDNSQQNLRPAAHSRDPWMPWTTPRTSREDGTSALSTHCQHTLSTLGSSNTVFEHNADDSDFDYSSDEGNPCTP